MGPGLSLVSLYRALWGDSPWLPPLVDRARSPSGTFVQWEWVKALVVSPADVNCPIDRRETERAALDEMRLALLAPNIVGAVSDRLIGAGRPGPRLLAEAGARLRTSAVATAIVETRAITVKLAAEPIRAEAGLALLRRATAHAVPFAWVFWQVPLLHQRPLPQSVSWPQGPHTAPSQAPFGHVCCWLAGQCPAPSQVASRVWMPFAHEAGRQTVLVPYCWHVPPTH